MKTRTTGLCLDANTGQVGRQVYLNKCESSNPNVKWQYHYLIVGAFQYSTATTGYCLDANTGALGRPAYMNFCEVFNVNLQWDLIH
ncbi:ricin-type beta-trefoil lectin domain protein [Nostoc sp.]|uniref:ricin-type beta-trefoil lectin domain protein n=1 Tax=Nostoc sp. TaxID=1180 RepID=UPI003FA5404E